MDISRTICDAARLARRLDSRIPALAEELIRRYGGSDEMVMVDLVTISSAVSFLVMRHDIVASGVTGDKAAGYRRENAALQADLAALTPALSGVVGDLRGSLYSALVESVGNARLPDETADAFEARLRGAARGCQVVVIGGLSEGTSGSYIT
jgi:hypothetical protein